MKNQMQTKLDNLIIKLFGKPQVNLQELPEEPSIIEILQKFGEWIENNKRSIYLTLLILVLLSILRNHI